MAGDTFPTRKAGADTTYGWTEADGSQTTAKADKDGHIRPKTPAGDIALAAHGLRTVTAEKATPPRKTKAKAKARTKTAEEATLTPEAAPPLTETRSEEGE